MHFFQKFTALLSLFLCLFSFSDAYTNPIRNPGGSDPFLVYTGGYYYLLTTSWSDVQISRATSIEGLKTATKKVVYSTSTSSRCCNVWAPEVHYLGGAWYIYYTAGTSANLDGQRLHVLKGKPTYLLIHPLRTHDAEELISEQVAPRPGILTATSAS